MVSSTLGICRLATSALSVRVRSKLTQSGHPMMSHGPSSSSLRTSWDLFPLRRWVDSATSASTGAAFRKYFLDVGIELEFASTNTPQQIGANERLGRTLAGMVRCLLSDSGLPPFLWGELFLTVSYLSNRAPDAALGNKRPSTASQLTLDTFGLSEPGRLSYRILHQEAGCSRLGRPPRRIQHGQHVLSRLPSRNQDSTRKPECSFYRDPSVAPDPDLMLDEGTLEYHEPDDLVRDVRNYATRLDLGSSSDNRTSDDVSMRQLLEQLRDGIDRDLRVTPARTETPKTPPIEQLPPPGTQSSSGGETPPAGVDSPVSSQSSYPSVPNARTLRELRKLAFFAHGGDFRCRTQRWNV